MRFLLHLLNPEGETVGQEIYPTQAEAYERGAQWKAETEGNGYTIRVLHG